MNFCMQKSFASPGKHAKFQQSHKGRKAKGHKAIKAACKKIPNYILEHFRHLYVHCSHFWVILYPLSVKQCKLPTVRCPCISVVPEATHEASQGPLKGTVSAKKALQGSETETRELLGGTEEKTHLPKAPSDLKQKCTQFLTPFLGTVFNALSLGVIHFVRSASLRNRYLIAHSSLPT